MSTFADDEAGPERIDLEDESPEALQALFDERGWGDGLPLVAPTEARVAAMLGGRDPDEEVAVLPPRFGRATRQALAVNAVLAGCSPELFPVVTTAIRALSGPDVNLQGVQATTHPVAPLVIVHGEAVADLAFNAGLGTLGPGTRANATVGRAIRLALLHVGGGYPGRGDQSTQGQPAKYSYCIAENAPESPWEAYHRWSGVDAASAVTVHCGAGPHNFHDMESESAARILEKGASAFTSLGSNNACISEGECFVVLCPEHAATIAREGWTRRDVQSFLFERARLPVGVFRRAFDQRRWRPWMQETLDADRLLPMTDHPDNFRVLVAGGAGKHSCVIPSWGVTKSRTLALDD
ncbi:MAG: hypothetical protein P8R42_30245 [Candidatus Binatia bacterium]|nr:hypothetical protein [Candidatus Binatia bacterium]